MTEIARLRARLRNVKDNVTEYRMTVTEARNLLLEIDRLDNRFLIQFGGWAVS